MELTVSTSGEQIRFTVTGLVDEQGGERLKKEFLDHKSVTFKDVVFDFRGVTHIGSAGIGKLMLFYKDVALNNGTITIENLSATVFDLFQTLRLNAIFTIKKAG